MDKFLKKYKTIIWVKIEFWFDREVLYWEWEIKDFEVRKLCDYIIFPRHWDRRVPTSKIKDFAVLQADDYQWNLELKLFSLTLNNRAEVKRLISRFEKNVNREASDNEINRFIKITLDPNILVQEKIIDEKQKYWRLTDIQRFKTSLVIKKQRIAKIITWSLIWFK